MRRPLFGFVLATLGVAALSVPGAAVGSGGWDHLGVGGALSAPALNGAVYALNSDNPGVLYAGGAFTMAGGNPKAARIARWNGSNWSSFGQSLLNGAVQAIAYRGGRVFVGGQFTNAGGHANADFLAVWNGSNWAPFCNTTGGEAAFGGSVDALQIIGNTLYVGGVFQNGANIDAADYLLACDLTTGASSATVTNDGDINGGIYALAADSNGVLYAGGQFINLAGNLAADHVAAYDGTWHAMGSGGGPSAAAVDSYVRSLAVSGTDVYVGTDSENLAGIVQADHVARWNGSAWSAVGANTSGTDGWFPTSSFIYGLKTSGSRVFASGSFQNANGVATADDIAYFDGRSWHAVGSDGAGNGPLSQQGTALTVYTGSLIVGGSFISAGGDTLADYIAGFLLKRPDVRSSAAIGGPFTGNNIYSPSGAGETRTISVARGHARTVYVDVQSDGIVPTPFKVEGIGGASGFAVSYFSGTTNVSGRVKAGTYSTASLAQAKHQTLKMVITVATSSAAHATFMIEAIPPSHVDRDAVRIVVNAQ